MAVLGRMVLVIMMAGLVGLGGCSGPEKVPDRPRTAAAPRPEKPTEAKLRQAIRKFNGAPYKYGGETTGGVDCSGLVMRVYEQVGVQLPRTSEQQFNAGEEVDTDELRYGDVVFFNKFCQRKYGGYRAASILNIFATETKQPCHVGIYIGNGRFVHSSQSSGGVTISRLNQDAWKRSLIGARRFLFQGD